MGNHGRGPRNVLLAGSKSRRGQERASETALRSNSGSRVHACYGGLKVVPHLWQTQLASQAASNVGNSTAFQTFTFCFPRTNAKPQITAPLVNANPSIRHLVGEYHELESELGIPTKLNSPASPKKIAPARAQFEPMDKRAFRGGCNRLAIWVCCTQVCLLFPSSNP